MAPSLQTNVRADVLLWLGQKGTGLFPFELKSTAVFGFEPKLASKKKFAPKLSVRITGARNPGVPVRALWGSILLERTGVFGFETKLTGQKKFAP